MAQSNGDSSPADLGTSVEHAPTLATSAPNSGSSARLPPPAIQISAEPLAATSPSDASSPTSPHSAHSPILSNNNPNLPVSMFTKRIGPAHNPANQSIRSILRKRPGHSLNVVMALSPMSIDDEMLSPSLQVRGVLTASTDSITPVQTVETRRTDEDDGDGAGDETTGGNGESAEEGNQKASIVYALHTFVANLEGQVCVLKGDSLVLLDDTNSYWWLVRCIKTAEVGYIPAENIEVTFRESELWMTQGM